jgi:hypothetical protein|tara:strand:+ start:48 stop:992 length:945 start_codon:yes stop_codon:yes gene_type:complete
MSKKLTLNAEKRKAIADVFQVHFESNSKFKEQHTNAIVNYNLIREKAKAEIEKIVRYHQPQEDVDTIRSMINKYGDRNGGQLHEDNCFYVSMPITKVDDEGREYDATDEVHIKFDMENDFARSYYRDELKSKGLNPDFKLSIEGDYSKRNPKYYADESAVDEYLGFSHKRNDATGIEYHKDKWDNDFKLWVIGTSYCHSRQFKVDESTLNFFKMYVSAQENVVKTHEQLYSYVENKMKKLRLGLKSYKYFDQAKKLADNLNVPLNESILNESSSMALSIYSPDNLASLLEDKVELTRDEKIAIARQQMQQQSYN